MHKTPFDIQALLLLGDAMTHGASGSIERMERAEQIKAVNSRELPKPRPDERDAWEALGLTFGEDTDDLFCNATLPEGWCVKPTDHSMWNDIVDERGRKRGQYFYKGVYYDRSAFMGMPSRRYSAGRDYSNDIPEGMVRGRVVDDGTGEVLYTTDMEAIGDRKSWDAGDEHAALALAWLSEHYPDHADPKAYWD